MKLIIAFILFVVCSSAFSSEAFFRPTSRQKIEIKEGDSFKGVIELWNVQNVSPEMIQEIVGKSFLDHFYVVSLDKARWSENNPEVVVIEGLFVLQKKIKTKVKKWKLGGIEINVTVKEFSTEKIAKREKGYQVLEGKFDLADRESSLLKFGIVGGFLSLILLLIYYVRKIKKRENANSVSVEKNWRKVLVEAKSRNDFFELYNNRRTWIPEEHKDKAVFKDFIQCSEAYLFKKHIEDYELEELKATIDPITKVLG